MPLNAEDLDRASRNLTAAAEKANQAADRLEEAVRQFRVLLDPEYGGTAPELLRALQAIPPCPPTSSS